MLTCNKCGKQGDKWRRLHEKCTQDQCWGRFYPVPAPPSAIAEPPPAAAAVAAGHFRLASCVYCNTPNVEGNMKTSMFPGRFSCAPQCPPNTYRNGAREWHAMGLLVLQN
jgi:hypothetical protein